MPSVQTYHPSGSQSTKTECCTAQRNTPVIISALPMAIRLHVEHQFQHKTTLKFRKFFPIPPLVGDKAKFSEFLFCTAK